MPIENNIKKILGARPLGQTKESSGLQPTTRLDINTVITRIYDKNGFPLVYISGTIYSFSRFTVTRTGDLIEIKFYQ